MVPVESVNSGGSGSGDVGRMEGQAPIQILSSCTNSDGGTCTIIVGGLIFKFGPDGYINIKKDKSLINNFNG